MIDVWLAEQCAALAEHPWLRADRALLADAARQAVEPLRVAVTGDVSSGKSSLVNALLGVEAAAVARAETTATVTWYRDPALAPPPRLGPAHHQVRVGFPLAGQVVLIDTPGVNTGSANQEVTDAMLAAGTEAAGAATVVVYLVAGPLSAGALARVRSFSTLVSGPLDDGANTVLGGAKADGFASGAASAGSDAARAVLVATLLRAAGRYASAAVALMPALGSLARRGAPDPAMFDTLRRIAGSAALRDAVADGWHVLASTAADLALDEIGFGSTFGVRAAAALLNARPDTDPATVRRTWEQLSGVPDLERLLGRMAAHREVYSVFAVRGRLRRLAARLGQDRAGPVATVLRELRLRPGLVDLYRRYVAVLLEAGRLPYVPDDERTAAVALLRGGPDLPTADATRWRARASGGGRAVRDRRIAEIVADACAARANRPERVP